MKAKRHAKILEIIRKYDVDTQEELCVRLNEAGYKVTQATVSRDIRELKLTKVAIKGGKQKYTSLYDAGTDLEEYSRVFKDGVISPGYGAEYSRDKDRIGNGHGSCSCTGCHGLQ